MLVLVHSKIWCFHIASVSRQTLLQLFFNTPCKVLSFFL